MPRKYRYRREEDHERAITFPTRGRRLAARDTHAHDRRTDAIWKQRILSSSCLYPRNSLPFPLRVPHVHDCSLSFRRSKHDARLHTPTFVVAKMAAVAIAQEDLPFLQEYQRTYSNFFLTNDRDRRYTKRDISLEKIYIYISGRFEPIIILRRKKQEEKRFFFLFLFSCEEKNEREKMKTFARPTRGKKRRRHERYPLASMVIYRQV